MTKNYKQYMVVAIFALIVTILPEIVLAADVAMGKIICKINDFAKGSTGKAVATIAVMTVGVGAFFGKANWGMVVLVVVGIGVLFGAPAIAHLIGGGTGAECA